MNNNNNNNNNNKKKKKKKKKINAMSTTNLLNVLKIIKLTITISKEGQNDVIEEKHSEMLTGIITDIMFICKADEHRSHNRLYIT